MKTNQYNLFRKNIVEIHRSNCVTFIKEMKSAITNDELFIDIGCK